MASILSQEEIDKLLDCVSDEDWKVPRNDNMIINTSINNQSAIRAIDSKGILNSRDTSYNNEKANDFLLRRINSQIEKIEYQDNRIQDLENKLNQVADIVLENKREIEKLAKRNLIVNFQN